MRTTTVPRLGLRANAAQFALLVGINGLVGALVGQERTLVPLLGVETFGLASTSAALAFVVAFGLAKALTNLAAGALADRLGRRRLLLVGWVIGLPVPFLVMWAPSWSWIVGANVLLGVNQGLTWSMTVVMKIDLVGPRRRGLAMGLNEFAGYLAVALSAWASGLLAARFGLRPEPLFLGVAVAALGLGLSFVVRDTRGHVEVESAGDGSAGGSTGRRFSEVLADGTFAHRELAAISRAGLVNNATDALAWGLLPLLFLDGGLDAPAIGLMAALYTGTWGIAQLGTGAISDRVGRRLPIAAGLGAQGLALAWIGAADGATSWGAASVLFGLGTALAYPALLAAVGDAAAPAWRATAVGVYRLWRDGGYVAGALGAAVLADVFGLSTRGVVFATGVVAGIAAFDVWRGLGGERATAGSGHDGSELDGIA